MKKNANPETTLHQKNKKKLGRKFLNIIRSNPDFTREDILENKLLTATELDKAILKVSQKGFIKLEGKKFIIDEVAFKEYHLTHSANQENGKGCHSHKITVKVNSLKDFSVHI